MLRVLFLCTGNTARSQMAEAWLRRLGGGRFEVHSAGVGAGTRINPLAVRVMREAGIDLSDQWVKDVDLYRGESFDHVITLCEVANGVCPTFPGPHVRAHWSVADPAAVAGSEEARLVAFATCRDETKRRVLRFMAECTSG